MIQVDEPFHPNQLRNQVLENICAFQTHYILQPADDGICQLFQDAFNVYKEQYFTAAAHCTVTVKRFERHAVQEPGVVNENADTLPSPPNEFSVLVLIKNTECENLDWDSAHHCIIKQATKETNSFYSYTLFSYVIVTGKPSALPNIEFAAQKKSEFEQDAKNVADHVANLGTVVEQVEGGFRRSLFEILLARINGQSSFLHPDLYGQRDQRELDLRSSLLKQMMKMTARNNTTTANLNELPLQEPGAADNLSESETCNKCE